MSQPQKWQRSCGVTTFNGRLFSCSSPETNEKFDSFSATTLGNWEPQMEPNEDSDLLPAKNSQFQGGDPWKAANCPLHYSQKRRDSVKKRTEWRQSSSQSAGATLVTVHSALPKGCISWNLEISILSKILKDPLLSLRSWRTEFSSVCIYAQSQMTKTDRKWNIYQSVPCIFTL